jgi:imidazolonepropionase-like amidohydrolase
MRLSAAILVLMVARPPAAGASVVVTDVNVVPMDRERVLAHRTVVVTDGVVARIGPAGSVKAPKGAVRVDGRGKYLLPGLVDFHVHLQSPDELLTYLAHGVTSVVNLNGAPRFLEWRAAAARPEFAGARLFTSGPTLDGFPPTTAKFVALATPEAGRAAVAAQKKAGYDLVKVYASVPPDVLEAMTAEGRAQGLAVVGHVSRLVGSVKAMRSGEAMIAHGEEFLMDLFDPATHSLDESRIPGLAAVAKETGVAVTPNLSAIQFMADQVDGLPALLARREMRDVTPAAYHELKASNNRYTNRPDLDEFRERVRQQLAVEKKLVKAFSDAGVPLLLGTDASTVGLPGYSDGEEIRLLRESKLSPFEVLRAATRTAGELLGRWTSLPAPMGVVGEGATADLLLVSKNPLEDPMAAVRPDGVVRAGRWFSRAELDRRQRAISSAYPKAKAFVDRFDDLVHAGKAAEAVALFEKERPRVGARTLKFDVLYSQGRELIEKDARTALPYVELAARLYPDEVSLQDNLGEARKLAGDVEGARHAYDAALALSREDETARRGRAALNP